MLKYVLQRIEQQDISYSRVYLIMGSCGDCVHFQEKKNGKVEMSHPQKRSTIMTELGNCKLCSRESFYTYLIEIKLVESDREDFVTNVVVRTIKRCPMKHVQSAEIGEISRFYEMISHGTLSRRICGAI